MNILKCPVTGEKILTVGANGVMKRENYSEVWFVLSDGSRMRVAISNNAKKNLKEKEADELYATIKKDWAQVIKSKTLDEKTKKKQLKRIDNLTYLSVESRDGLIIKKQKDVDK